MIYLNFPQEISIQPQISNNPNNIEMLYSRSKSEHRNQSKLGDIGALQHSDNKRSMIKNIRADKQSGSCPLTDISVK